MPEYVPLVLTIVTIVVTISGTGVVVRRSLVNARNSELEALVRTRGEQADDYRQQIDDLQQRVTHLEGLMDAMTTLKAREIAEAVVEGLLDSHVFDHVIEQVSKRVKEA